MKDINGIELQIGDTISYAVKYNWDIILRCKKVINITKDRIVLSSGSIKKENREFVIVEKYSKISNNDIFTELKKISEKIDKNSTITFPTQPYTPERIPYEPPYEPIHSCQTCHIDFSKNLNYSCMRSDCPNGRPTFYNKS